MAEMNFKSILATILLLLIPYLYIRRYQTQKADALYAKQHNCQPLKTLPYKWPLGLDLLWTAYHHAMEGRILRFFTTLIKTVPPTFEQKLFGISGVDTVDPKNIEAVLGTQFTAFGMGDRPEVWYPLIGPGIFTQDGEDWKHSRDLLRPLFLSKRVDNFLEVQESVEALIKCIPDGEVADFQPLFFRFTLDTTTYLLLGRSIRSLADENEEAEAFGESFRISQDYLAHRGRLGPLHWMLNNKTFRDANATVHKWIDGEIKEALAVHDSKDTSAEKRTKTDYGFLGSLMEETQEPKVLRDALLNVLLAGRDTTACLLTWTMRLLVKHKNVMAKLREESRRQLVLEMKQEIRIGMR
jgi:cytochrome P450